MNQKITNTKKEMTLNKKFKKKREKTFLERILIQKKIGTKSAKNIFEKKFSIFFFFFFECFVQSHFFFRIGDFLAHFFWFI